MRPAGAMSPYRGCQRPEANADRCRHVTEPCLPGPLCAGASTAAAGHQERCAGGHEGERAAQSRPAWILGRLQLALSTVRVRLDAGAYGWAACPVMRVGDEGPHGGGQVRRGRDLPHPARGAAGVTAGLRDTRAVRTCAVELTWAVTASFAVSALHLSVAAPDPAGATRRAARHA